MLDDQVPGGPGLFEITRANGERLITNVRRLAGTGRTPGSVLIAVAAWLLALIGGGALFVSFSAQYAYIFAVRRQDAASVIEALLLDLLMIVFTLLALGLSRAGKSSRAERALILACAAASSYMNVSAADVASPRSVAAYAVAPIALAVVVDRVVAVIRRHVLADQEPSAWITLGRAAAASGQARRPGAAVLAAVRAGRARDGPGSAPDGAGRRAAASTPRHGQARGDRATTAPRRLSCWPCTAPTRTMATAAKRAGSPPSWPRGLGCRPGPPAATCTPSWTERHHDRGPLLARCDRGARRVRQVHLVFGAAGPADAVADQVPAAPGAGVRELLGDHLPLVPAGRAAPRPPGPPGDEPAAPRRRANHSVSRSGWAAPSGAVACTRGWKTRP